MHNAPAAIPSFCMRGTNRCAACAHMKQSCNAHRAARLCPISVAIEYPNTPRAEHGSYKFRMCTACRHGAMLAWYSPTCARHGCGFCPRSPDMGRYCCGGSVPVLRTGLNMRARCTATASHPITAMRVATSPLHGCGSRTSQRNRGGFNVGRGSWSSGGRSGGRFCKATAAGCCGPDPTAKQCKRKGGATTTPPQAHTHTHTHTEPQPHAHKHTQPHTHTCTMLCLSSDGGTPIVQVHPDDQGSTPRCPARGSSSLRRSVRYPSCAS